MGTFVILNLLKDNPPDFDAISPSGVNANPVGGSVLPYEGWSNNLTHLSTNVALLNAIVKPDLLSLSSAYKSGGTGPHSLPTGIIDYVYDIGANIISLDGSTPVSFFGLPVNFTLTSVTLTLSGGDGQTNNASVTCTQTLDLTLSSEGNTLTLHSVRNAPADSLLVDYNGLLVLNFTITPTIFQLLTGGFHIQASGNNTSVLDFGTILFRIAGNNNFLTGTYTLFPFPSGWILNTPSPNPTTIGGSITIESTPPVGSSDGGLEYIRRINLSYIDDGNIARTESVQSPDFVSVAPDGTTLIFLIPVRFYLYGYISYPGLVPSINTRIRTVTVSADVKSVNFEGSFPLGTIDILFENASGIYTLINNKTNDTFYDRNSIVTSNNIGPLGLDIFESISYYGIDEDTIIIPGQPGNNGLMFVQEDINSFDSLDNFEGFSSNNAASTVNLRILDPFAKTGFIGG